MSTVRVYKSTDPGAPPHPSATRGSQAALLRACLVTGYGSGENFKAPAGWEEPFSESGNLAVFRALAGARQFFQIDDTQSSANVAMMRAFESMSDLQNGQGQWGEQLFGKRSTSAGSVEWWLIADEKTAYVFLDTTRGLTAHVFGEYQSFVDDDPYNSYFSGHVTSTGLYTTSTTNAAGNIPIMHTSNKLGDTFTLSSNSWNAMPAHNKGAVAVLSMLGYSGGQNFVNSSNNFPTIPNNYPVFPILIISGQDGQLCGKQRGICYPCANRPKAHGVPFEVGETTFLPLDVGYTTNVAGQGQIWVDISGSWEG